MGGWKDWQIGEVVTESDFQNFVQDQVVQVYATSAARGSALGTAVTDGMVSYLTGTNELSVYDGTNWGAISQALSPNYIINGAFDIWQRGTSFSNPSNNAYTSDRWILEHDGTGATRTISQQAFTPNDVNAIGFGEGSTFFRYAVSNAGSGNTFNDFNQRIENVRTLAGQTVTLSFWAKAAASLTLETLYRRDFGSGGSSPDQSSNGTVSVTTSWQRFTQTFTLASLSGRTIGNNSFTQIRFRPPANTTFTLDIWGVQLEAGNVATPFKRAANTLQGELAACQRYFQRIQANDGFSHFAAGSVDSATNARFLQFFIVPMRASPTFSSSGTFQVQANSTFAVSALANPGSSTNSALVLDATISGATAGNACFLRAANNSATRIDLSSEL